MVELHDKLYTGILAGYKSPAHSYLPHITVGRLRDDMAFAKALEAVGGTTAIFETMVKEASLIRIESKDKLLLEAVVGL